MNKPAATAEPQVMAVRRKELLAFADDLVQRVLLAHGIDPAVAAQCGAAVADGLAEEQAGQIVYFPYDYGYKLAPRDQEILEAHRNGASIAQLRVRYKMSEEGIKKVLKRAATRNPHLNQIPLFGA